LDPDGRTIDEQASWGLPVNALEIEHLLPDPNQRLSELGFRFPHQGEATQRRNSRQEQSEPQAAQSA
jgi:hypothetical protein